MKILITAEHASSAFGGEALIPYQYFRCLRELGVDVHLLVHERTKRELCSAFPNDIERLHFVEDSLVNIWCNAIGKLMPDRIAVFTLGSISHFATQIRQRRIARTLIPTYGFAIVHEPIPVSPKLPSMMFGFSVPVIIGPMNGGMDYPPHFDLAGRVERAIVAILRLSSALWNVIVPGKRYAALLLVANKRTYDALPFNIRRKRFLEFADNGVDVSRFRGDPSPTSQKTLRIIYIGRLVDWKRVDLLISACRRLIGYVNFRVHIVGHGPLYGALQQQVQQMLLASYVQFHGWLPQATAADLLRNSDVLVLPSMRECGGAVVLEAMATGIPVIATKWGGPAEYIAPETGILIPPETPEQFVGELANAILWMAKNSEARVKMGHAGRQRVQALYSWELKAKALLKIYKDVVSAELGNDHPEVP